MNEVSIIINGVRYDAVIPHHSSFGSCTCDACDLTEVCDKADMGCITCPVLIGSGRCFKKSNKSFEK